MKESEFRWLPYLSRFDGNIEGWTVTNITNCGKRSFWLLNWSNHENGRHGDIELSNGGDPELVRFKRVPDQHEQREDNCNDADVIPKATLMGGYKSVQYGKHLFDIVVHVQTVS